MHQTFSAIIEKMGGTVLGLRNPERESSGISVGGSIIHELGTIRMGNDPKTSALNKYCQAHDVKNLFVADAAPFVSNPDKNPTLTICALAWRTAEYLADWFRAESQKPGFQEMYGMLSEDEKGKLQAIGG